MPRRVPNAVRVLAVLLAVALTASAAHAVIQFGGAPLDRVFGTYVYQAIEALALAVIVARVVAVRRDRVSCGLLALGFALNLVGDIVWAAVYHDGSGAVPAPSIADVLYLSSYLPFGAAAALIVDKSRARSAGSGLWLDGVVVALTLTTAMAYFVLPPLLDGWRGADVPSIVTNAAYPVGDAMVTAALVASLALRNWKLDLRSALLAVTFGLWVCTDAVYLVQAAQNTYTSGGVLDLGWLVAATLASVAVWTPSRAITRDKSGTRLSAAMPSLAGAAAVVLLVLDEFTKDRGWLPIPVALLALLIFLRFSLVSRDNHRLIDHNRQDAVTDPLTGLANRRRLLEDLAVAHERRRALILFDLDGFKLYNDTFGHPAGDILLQMIGRALAAAVGRDGRAYRLGGDEFCAFVDHEGPADALGHRLAAAMSREGHGFRVGASFGATVIAPGRPSPARALPDADQRLYDNKRARRVSDEDQAAGALLALVAERMPQLEVHVTGVADLAASVARRLGMTDGETAQVRRAAELHDIGKLAIPDTILDKPGPLTDDEWGLMRRHTEIGERVLAAAAALRPVAAIVRASHERWDGTGYPDGTAGTDIPLGARVVFACDAFDDMTSTRPYNQPLTYEQALAELCRCSGSQFDPEVVVALVAEVRQRVADPLAARALTRA